MCAMIANRLRRFSLLLFMAVAIIALRRAEWRPSIVPPSPKRKDD